VNCTKNYPPLKNSHTEEVDTMQIAYLLRNGINYSLEHCRWCKTVCFAKWTSKWCKVHHKN